MNPQQFLKEFGHLVETPGGVGHLRKVALHLAGKGLLTARSSQDGTASSLIAKETVLDEPSWLPAGWIWTSLGGLGRFTGGGTPSKGRKEFWGGSIPWVTPKDMKRPYIAEAIDTITDAAVDGSSAKRIPTGSLLMVVRGMILAHTFPVALTRSEVTVNQDMKALVLDRPEVGEFVLRYLQGSQARMLANVARSTHGTCRLDSEVMASFSVPLPPLPEQKRIVAKVDQLMALCDDLEARQQERRTVAVKANQAALHAVVEATEPKTIKTTWKRVSSNFDVLHDLPENVQELRQAVLAFGLDGRLTNNGERVAPTITVAIDKRRQESGASVALPAVPPEWRWATFGDITSLVTSGSRGWKKYLSASGPLFIRSQDINRDRLADSGVASVSLPRGVEGSRTRVYEGDLLITITGANVGKAAFVDRPVEEAYVSQHVALVRPVGNVFGPFLHRWLIAEHCGRGLLVGRSYGDKPGLNLDNIRTLPVPLPPLPEQKRIVAKVDQLMALCDDLEAKLKQSQADGERLMKAVVERLVA